ncbi:MAG: type II toxin-antitoxin system RelE family toxin [Chloroflexota bacterium]
MSPYRVELRPAAARALRKLDPDIQPRIQGAIALLAQDPRPLASRALRGRPGFRIRVGDYRILYTVADVIVELNTAVATAVSCDLGNPATSLHTGDAVEISARSADAQRQTSAVMLKNCAIVRVDGH